MIGIKEISSYVPQTFRDNLQNAKNFGHNEDFVRNRLGGRWLPVIKPEMDTSDIAVLALDKLLEKLNADKEEIDCIAVCTQNPDGEGLPHTSAIVQDKAQLPSRVAAFDISLGCSGYVYCLNIVKGFMKAAGLINGILVTADPYSKIIDPEDGNTVMLFGDAATATFLTNNLPVLGIGKSLYSTDGSGKIYLENKAGKLHMNGRKIFNFAAINVVKQIKDLLLTEGLTDKDIDRYVLHQGSRYIIDTIRKKLKIHENKVPIRLEKTGNTVSSSIPLILQEFIHNREIKKILISGFGVGLSWGSMLIDRINK